MATRKNFIFSLKGIILSLLFAGIFSTTAFAQEAEPPITELKIGDQVPDLLLNNILDQPEGLELKDLYNSNGFLILNFWATWCAPCLTELTLLDSLKKKHPDAFNVLSVTYQSEKEVTYFLSRDKNADVKTGNLTLTVQDTILNKLFPHKFLPHNIWIDSLGYVRAITGKKGISEANILNFYERYRSFETKEDQVDFNPYARFSLGDTIFTYRSIVTPRIEGINGGMLGGLLGGQQQRYFEWNAVITQFFWSAYSGFRGHVRHNLMEIETRDSLKFYWPVRGKAYLLSGSKYSDYNDWKQSNTFCYDLVLPKSVPDSVVREYIFSDLQRAFSVRAKIVDREIDCWVMENDSASVKLPRSDAIPFIQFKDSKLIMRGITMYDLTRYLSDFSPRVKEPFVNRVMNFNADEKFDLELPIPREEFENGVSIHTVMKQLGKYGFRFEKKPWKYPILRLIDQN